VIRVKVLAAAVLAMAARQAGADTLTVSAASSLAEAFRELAAGFEAAHPGHEVLLNLGGSGLLLQQISKGAPVDVFASADEQTMLRAVAAGRTAGRPLTFASNELVLIQPAQGRPLTSLSTLTGDAVQRIALGNVETVPAGRYAQQALEAQGLWSALQAKLIPTQNVRQALDYVARGEVDAGFVYGSDARLAGDRVRVALTVSLPRPVRYTLAVLKGAEGESAAQQFVDHVLSAAGQRVLAAHGFTPPD